MIKLHRMNDGAQLLIQKEAAEDSVCLAACKEEEKEEEEQGPSRKLIRRGAPQGPG